MHSPLFFGRQALELEFNPYLELRRSAIVVAISLHDMGETRLISITYARLPH